MPENRERERGVALAESRRSHERHALEEVRGTLVYRGVAAPCRVVDISLGGCRIRVQGPMLPNALEYVELKLRMHGDLLHLGGTTRWRKQGNLIGVHFIFSSVQSRSKLSELLESLVRRDAAKASSDCPAPAEARPSGPALSSSDPCAISAPTPETEIDCEEPSERTEAPTLLESLSSDPIDQPAPGECAVEGRAAGSALVRFLTDGSERMADVCDLSLDGCRLHFDMRSKLSGARLVEIQFRRPHPFAVAGFAAVTADPRILAVEFLGESLKKREEIEALIAEEAESQNVPFQSLCIAPTERQTSELSN
jgi:hypothetical protein